MKNIVYVGNFGWPDENAAGKRVFSNAKLFQLAGYNPVLVGRCQSAVEAENIKGNYRDYNGISCFSFPESLIKSKRYNCKAVFKCFKSFIVENYEITEIKAFVIYGTPSLSLFNNFLISFAHKHSIPVISDVVDWFTIKTENPIFNFIKNLDVYHQMHLVNTKVDGLIVISNFLKNYYKDKIENIVVLPPLEINNSKIYIKNMNDKSEVNLIYAGIPFRLGQAVTDFSQVKDRLDIAIKGVALANSQGCNFKFTICGLTKDEFVTGFPDYIDFIEQLGNSIEFLGNVSMNKVHQLMENMDYSIILRDINRMTQAGFSTKISESISLSVPVITTYTSDIEKYLSSDNLCSFVDITDINNLACQLKNIYFQTFEIENKEPINNPFYYENYLNQINSILTL